MTLEITITATPDPAQIAANFGLIQEDWQESVETEFRMLGPDLVQALFLNTPVGHSAKLASSTKAVLESNPQQISLKLIQDARARVLSGEATIYRPFASLGRSAGRQPPSAPLARWALAKLPGVTSAVEARSAGFALAKNIAKKGTPGNDYITDTLAQESSRLQQAANNIADNLVLIIMDL